LRAQLRANTNRKRPGKPEPWECLLSWIAIALVSAAVLAMSNVIDKAVMERYSRSQLTLPLMIGIAQVLIGIVVLAAVRIPDGVTLASTSTALLSGLLFGVGANLMMRVLYSQEVSRTIPVMQTSPIFAALIGVAFLSESVSALQWVAIVATVGGAVAISSQIGTSFRSILITRSFFLLILSALIWAAGNVIGKVAIDDLPIMYTHGLRSLGLGSVFLIVAARPGPIRDIVEFARNRSPAIGIVALNDLVIGNLGLMTLLWALSLGPVSLVTAVFATRALFVVVYSTAVALIWKGALSEQTSRGAIAMKFASSIVIVGGIIGIAI
jgi:uncharacterized membrane protein